MGDVSFNSIMNDLSNALARTVLLSVNDLKNNYGITKSIAFMQGAKSEFIRAQKLNELPTYGSLDILNARNLQLIIDELIDRELLEIYEIAPLRPIVRITTKGVDFLKGTDEFEFIVKMRNADLIELDEFDILLKNKLRRIRNEIAKKNNLPPYTICWNETLDRLARDKPENVEQLRAIKGIGESFIEKCGVDVLKEIQKFKSESKK
jgi:ATP-dependent DNA helicase RecQ